MLIDIDHIALSSTMIEKDVKIFESLGYETKFIEKKVSNLKIKRPFLNKFKDKHDIALLKMDRNFGIELINHGYIRHVEPSIIPIFQNLPKEMIVYRTNETISDSDYKTHLKFFDIPIFLDHKNDDSKFKFNEIILSTNKLTKSIDFWNQLGFRPVSSNNNYYKMKFQSILNANEYFINLKKNTNVIDNTLNDRGCNCLTFISNSIKNENEFSYETVT